MEKKTREKTGTGSPGKERPGNRYSKEQVLSSSRYRCCRDLVQALLKEDRKYSLEEVERMMMDYRKGKVK